MSSFINLNGKLLTEGEPVILPNNRGFRYGDGLFETIKSVKGNMPLETYHYERLFHGMKELYFERPSWFTHSFLKEQIASLLLKNNHLEKARIRLMIFRGNGSVYDHDYQMPNFLVESIALPADDGLNEFGWSIDIFPRAFKSRDLFANIKSNNFLPYAMAAIYAKQHHLNDCLLLNSSKRICDATIANVFLVRNKIIYTPALTEGCIAGVMRRHLLEKLPTIGYEVNETAVTPDQLTEASEIFLTNAVFGMRWVKNCGNIEYRSGISAEIYNKLLTPLFL